MNSLPLEKCAFLFITGVEGSGTTMMLKLLDSLPDVVALGGNYWTPEQKKAASQFNTLTERLWNKKSPPDNVARKKIMRDISQLPVPYSSRLVAYKRSYPFLDPYHLPDLADIVHFSPQSRLLVMRRSPNANTRSILRRGFEKKTDEAIARTAMALQALDTQISNNGLPSMQINYEEIISQEKKQDILEKLTIFLQLKPTSLTDKSDLITGPTLTTKN